MITDWWIIGMITEQCIHDRKMSAKTLRRMGKHSLHQSKKELHHKAYHSDFRRDFITLENMKIIKRKRIEDLQWMSTIKLFLLTIQFCLERFEKIPDRTNTIRADLFRITFFNTSNFQIYKILIQLSVRHPYKWR